MEALDLSDNFGRPEVPVMPGKGMGPIENLEKVLGLNEILGKDLDHSKKLKKALSPNKKVLGYNETTKKVSRPSENP